MTKTTSPYCYFLLLELILASTLVLLPGEWLSARIWTGTNGKKIEAELLEVKGNSVKFRKKDGSIVTTKITIFSEEDQKFIRNFEKQNLSNTATTTKPAEPIVVKTRLSELPGAVVREKLEDVPAPSPNCFLLTKDGQHIITGPIKKPDQQELEWNVVLWNIAEKKAEKSFTIPSPSPIDAKISRNGRVLAVGFIPGEIPCFDMQTGQNVLLKPFSDLFSCLSLSPNGQTLAANELRNHSVIISEVVYDAKPRSFSLFSAAGPVSDMCFDDTGQMLAAVRGNSVSVWDLKTRKEIWTAQGLSRAARCFAHEPKSNRLISPGFAGDIQIWDMKTGKKEAELSCEGFRPYHVTLSADGRYMATTGFNQANSTFVVAWDMKTFNAVMMFPCSTNARIHSAFFPDNSILVYGQPPLIIELPKEK